MDVFASISRVQLYAPRINDDRRLDWGVTCDADERVRPGAESMTPGAARRPCGVTKEGGLVSWPLSSAPLPRE